MVQLWYSHKFANMFVIFAKTYCLYRLFYATVIVRAMKCHKVG